MVRGSLEQFTQPWYFTTTDKVETFFKMLYKTDIGDFAKQMEGYSLSGAMGATNTYEEQLNNLKSDTANLIFASLGES